MYGLFFCIHFRLQQRKNYRNLYVRQPKCIVFGLFLTNDVYTHIGRRMTFKIQISSSLSGDTSAEEFLVLLRKVANR